MDYRWLALFVGQVGVGLALLFVDPAAENADLGRMLLASAFGQAATGNLRATR